MKQSLNTIAVFAIILYSFLSCKKTPTDPTKATANQKLIEPAKLFFEENVEHLTVPSTGNARIDASKSINWSTAYILNLPSGPAVIVPVHYIKSFFVKTNFGGSKLFSLDQLTRLVVYKDLANGYHAELVTGFPDSSALTSYRNDFTGIIFVESWSGQRLHQFKYNCGGQTLKFQPQTGGQFSGIEITPARAVTPDMVITTCYEIDGYNYSSDDPDDGYYWSEPAGCSSTYIDDGGSANGSSGLSAGSYGVVGGGSANNNESTLIVASGTNPIGNIQDYLKCFTNVGGTDHAYSVTVCVDQPDPGTREAWGFSNGTSGTSATGNPFDVGHTFLVFTESYGGNTITRNVGFYPKTSVNPVYPSDQGQLDDNESSIYNISLTVTIYSAQFFNMLNYVSQGNNPGYLYNLNSNNCTTFAITALQAGSINLSTQIGTWPGGSGYDPGDLGEDIRSMPLQSNMTRNTVENAHPNVGTCN